MATAGMVCSVIALALVIIVLILAAVGLAIFSSAVKEIQSDPNFQALLNFNPIC